MLEAFMDTQNKGIENQLRMAQTRQALGSAAKSNMYAQLLGDAFGPDEGQGQPSNQGQTYNENPLAKIGTNSGYGQTLSGGHPSDRQSRSIEKLRMVGIIKETPHEQEERETRTARAKEWAASDVKAAEGWNNTITAAHTSMPNLENIQDISANPVYQNMFKNPEYFGKDIQWLSRFGTPEEQKLINGFNTNVKDLYKSTAADFKGAFREFEKKLFDQAIPSSTDSIYAQQAKVNAIMGLRKVVSDRLTLAQNILRSSNGQITPAAALDIADKQINTKDIVKQIESRFKESAERQKSENNSSPENTNQERQKRRFSDKDLTPQNVIYTSKQLNISIPETIKRLKEKGYTVPVMDTGAK